MCLRHHINAVNTHHKHTKLRQNLLVEGKQAFYARLIHIFRPRRKITVVVLQESNAWVLWNTKIVRVRSL